MVDHTVSLLCSVVCSVREVEPTGHIVCLHLEDSASRMLQIYTGEEPGEGGGVGQCRSSHPRLRSAGRVGGGVGPCRDTCNSDLTVLSAWSALGGPSMTGQHVDA